MSGVRLEVGGAPVYAGTGGAHAAKDDSDANAEAAMACVVFVHGAGMDHTVWAMPTRHFARKGLRVLAPDLPGHGRSAGPAKTSIRDMADWLAALLDATGTGSATVVGHSMGSLVAWQFARRHPARCRALALLGTSMPMPVTDMLLDAAHDNHHAAIDMANAWSHSEGGTLGANANPGVWMLGAGERLLERAGPGVFHADLAACNGFDADATDGEVACPALVIAGDADRMTPAKAGLDVAAHLPDAKVVRLPGCGHAMLNERPNEVLDALIGIVQARG